MMSARRVRPPRAAHGGSLSQNPFRWTPALLALAVLAGCMPLPPQAGGIDVGVGGTSDQWTVRFDPQLGTPALLVNRTLEKQPGQGAEGADAAITDEAAEAAVREVVRSRPQWFRWRD